MDSPFDPVLMRELIHSRAWQHLMSVLIPEYWIASARLDAVKEDHRYAQGVKAAMKAFIEGPYAAADAELPLDPRTDMPELQQAKRRQARTRRPKPPPESPRSRRESFPV